jgi:hypothetical protein
MRLPCVSIRRASLRAGQSRTVHSVGASRGSASARRTTYPTFALSRIFPALVFQPLRWAARDRWRISFGDLQQPGEHLAECAFFRNALRTGPRLEYSLATASNSSNVHLSRGMRSTRRSRGIATNAARALGCFAQSAQMIAAQLGGSVLRVCSQRRCTRVPPCLLIGRDRIGAERRKTGSTTRRAGARRR